MKRSTLIALAVTAALLAGYLLLFDVDHASRLADRRLLPGFAATRVARIAIARHAAPRIELARAGEGWVLRAPVRGRADGAAISAILSAVEFLESQRALGDDVSDKQRGLDPPRIRLRLSDETGKRLAELQLGVADPSGQRRYVKLGTAVHVVSGELYRRVDRDPDELRDPQLLPWAGAQVRRVEFSGGDHDGRVAFIRGERGRWTFARDEIASRPVEGTGVNRGRAKPGLPRALDALRAARFTADGADGKPRREAQIAGPRGERVILRFAGQCPGSRDLRLVGLRDVGGGAWVRACVGTRAVSAVERFHRDPSDRWLTRAREARLAGVTISFGQKSLSLRRDAGAWRINDGSHAGKEADAEVVRGLVDSLRLRGDLSAADAAQLARLAASPDHVTLEQEDGAKETLYFGAPRQGSVPVRRGSEKAVLWVSRQRLPTLTADPLAFRSREVLASRVAEIERIVTVRSGAREVLERAAGGWRVSRPVGATADRDGVARLLEALAGLRAKRLIPAPRGFCAATVVEVTTAAAQDLARDARPGVRGTVQRLELGAVKGDVCPGRIVGGAWFELPVATCRLLAAQKTARGAAR